MAGAPLLNILYLHLDELLCRAATQGGLMAIALKARRQSERERRLARLQFCFLSNSITTLPEIEGRHTTRIVIDRLFVLRLVTNIAEGAEHAFSLHLLHCRKQMQSLLRRIHYRLDYQSYWLARSASLLRSRDHKHI